MPLAMGGIHHPSNVQALHTHCHREKSAQERKTIDQFKNQAETAAKLERERVRHGFAARLEAFAEEGRAAEDSATVSEDAKVIKE